MSDFVTELLKIVVAPSAIILVIAYLVRKYLDNASARELEVFKSKMSHEFDLLKISFEKNLDKSLFEYQTRYSFYHNKLVEIIATLYGLMNDAKDSMTRLTATMQMTDGTPLKDKKKETADIFNKFGDYYSKNRIFLDQIMCTKIEELLDALHLAFITFDISQMGDGYEKDETGGWVESFDIVRQKASPIALDLEKKFREIVSIQKK